jgi:hypothetical protein
MATYCYEKLLLDKYNYFLFYRALVGDFVELSCSSFISYTLKSRLPNKLRYLSTLKTPYLIVGVAIILASSVFSMLPPSLLPNQHSAFGTFPGENGKIAFTSTRDSNAEIYVMNPDGSGQTNISNNPAIDYQPSWSPDGSKIAFTSTRDGENNGWYEVYVMNADGSGQTRLTNNPAYDQFPSWSPDGSKIAFASYTENRNNGKIYVMNAGGSGQTRLTNDPGSDDEPAWGPATATEPGDTTPPVITVPEDIVVEATSADGAEVTYTVTAQDNVDGNATLEADGSTIIQDNVGGNITISCNPPSGSVFPVGDTEVQCSATDEAGNEGTASFTVTVNAPPTPAEAIDELISTVENLDDNVPQSVKTSLSAPLNEASDILNDDNPNNDRAVCGKLGAFINQVNANERRDMLTADQADGLRTQAEDIIRNKLLGC